MNEVTFWGIISLLIITFIVFLMAVIKAIRVSLKRKTQEYKGEWWENAKRWYKEDTGDLEYDSQKIYTHYLNRLGILKKRK